MPKLTYHGNLRQRGKTWEWRVSVGGKRHTMTFRGTKGEAVEQLKAEYKRLEAEANRRRSGLPGQLRMSELLDRYDAEVVAGMAPGSHPGYRTAIGFFRQYFEGKLGDLWLDRIRSGHVKSFLTWRRSAGLQPATIAKERTMLHGVFAYAEEVELLDANPVSKTSAIDYDEREPVILAPEQYECLLSACEHDPMLYAYILVLGESGLRCDSEALALQWPDLDFEKAPGWIHVRARVGGRRTKSGRGRRVPMTRRLRMTLREHAIRFRFALYEGSTTPWVFHRTAAHGRHRPGGRFRRREKAVSRAAKIANLPEEFHTHDLRHTRATTWLAEGKSVVHVQKALGHSSISTTMRYEHLVPDVLRTLVEDDELMDLVEAEGSR